MLLLPHFAVEKVEVAGGQPMAQVPTDGQTSEASLSLSVALTLAAPSDHPKRVNPSPGPPLVPQTLTWWEVH